MRVRRLVVLGVLPLRPRSRGGGVVIRPPLQPDRRWSLQYGLLVVLIAAVLAAVVVLALPVHLDDGRPTPTSEVAP